MDAAVDAGDLAATVAAVAGLCRSAVVLQDRFLAVLASAPAPGTTDQAGGAGGAGDLPLSRSGCPLVRDLLHAAATGAGGPALVELPKHGTTPARLVARVTARGDLLGFLTAAAVDRAAYVTLEAAAPVVALLLRAEDRLCRLFDGDQRSLFLDLMAGRSAASSVVRESLVVQGRRFGHDLEQPHWPLVFQPGGGDGDGTARLEGVVHAALRETRRDGGPAPIVGVDGDAVVVFLPDRHPAGPAGLAQRVRTLAARRGQRVMAGWGPRCDDLDSYAAGVTRARWVVDVLAGLPGDPVPAGYDDLGIYGLLYEKRDQDQLARFADRWLGPILEHGELTHTLRVLLETGGPSAAATALFVHISTLKYRLRKIESILGVDLSDPEVCFNLRLAFKIRAVHDRLTGSRR
jgi:hypothetical protein